MRPFCVRTGSFCLPSEGADRSGLPGQSRGRGGAEGVVEGVGFEPTVTLPPQWFSRASVIQCPSPLLAGLLVRLRSVAAKIIPHISRGRRPDPDTFARSRECRWGLSCRA
jgi:hypothetical protein